MSREGEINIDNTDTSENQNMVLQRELGEILKEQFSFGRGANNPHDNREVENSQNIVSRAEQSKNRANEIAFKICANEMKVNPEDYSPVEVINKFARPEERLKNIGYHPDDVFVPFYEIDKRNIRKSGEQFFVYRKKGLGAPINSEDVWKQSNMSWKEVMNKFGIMADEVLNPVEKLKGLKESQKVLGRNTDDINDAIGQIYQTLKLETPE